LAASSYFTNVYVEAHFSVYIPNDLAQTAIKASQKRYHDAGIAGLLDVTALAYSRLAGEWFFSPQSKRPSVARRGFVSLPVKATDPAHPSGRPY